MNILKVKIDLKLGTFNGSVKFSMFVDALKLHMYANTFHQLLKSCYMQSKCYPMYLPNEFVDFYATESAKTI